MTGQHTRRDILVIDLEATCDDRGKVRRHEMEIIEIGAVLVDAKTLAPRAEFQTFVRPVRNPVLTRFCTELTSIRQQEVDRAPSFPHANEALRAFIQRNARDEHAATFASWGDFDRRQFLQDARYHGVWLPFEGRHINLKRAFAEREGSGRRYGLRAALRRVGIPFGGTHHRGIDDARNIAKLVPYALGHRRFDRSPVELRIRIGRSR